MPIADLIKQSAARIGANPVDLGTVMSYETGGTFNPSLYGGAGGRHLGLIQFGPNEAQRYGARPGQSFEQQLPAVESYLKDRGFKPGMGLADLYSTINAGRPGLFNASDAGNGGAPGTVLDKVQNQMGSHRAKVEALFGGAPDPAGAAGGGMVQPAGHSRTPQAGTALAEALPGATLPGGTFNAPAIAAQPDPFATAATNIGQQFDQNQKLTAVTDQARRAALFGGLSRFYG